MRSRTTSRFRSQFAGLPKEIQRRAKVAYKQFKRDPSLRALRFKQVHPSLPVFSVRVTRGYRAVGKRDEKGMLWFWIGTHADYEQLIKKR